MPAMKPATAFDVLTDHCKAQLGACEAELLALRTQAADVLRRRDDAEQMLALIARLRKR